MKMWKCSLTAAVGTAAALVSASAETNAAVVAGDPPPDDRMSEDRPASFYRNCEFSVDGFAVGTIAERGFDRSFGYFRHHAHYGAGAGGNFFFCRYLGIGGEFYTEDQPGPFVASTSGNLIARYPIPHTPIAPYVYGGGGHDFDSVQQSFGQVGAGLEVRFARHVGVFVDARYVFAGQTDDYGVARGGVRLNF